MAEDVFGRHARIDIGHGLLHNGAQTTGDRAGVYDADVGVGKGSLSRDLGRSHGARNQARGMQR